MRIEVDLPQPVRSRVACATYPQLIKALGSKRRVVEAYWQDELLDSEERILEDSVPPEILIGYKPIPKI